MTPTEFADILRSYCFRTGASVSSYGRTPHHNKDVGGHPNSLHMLWLAADVVYDEEIPEATRKLAAARLGVKLVVEGSHDHLQSF